MTPETFRGPELRAVLDAVRRAYGEDAMIVRTRGPAEAAGAYEVTVMTPARGHAGTLRGQPRADKPYLIALVGPAGAGKSTAAAKLAVRLRDECARVALLSMDCFKIGALEQMQLFSELIDVPLDLLHDSAATLALRARLACFDTVIIDTPGRRSGPGDAAWGPVLAALAPDEVHLVVHAGLRADVLRGSWRAWSSLAPDHVLPTHVDELPDENELYALLETLRLPARWIGGGAELMQPLRVVPRKLTPELVKAEPDHVPEHAPAIELMLRQQHATVFA